VGHGLHLSGCNFIGLRKFFEENATAAQPLLSYRSQGTEIDPQRKPDQEDFMMHLASVVFHNLFFGPENIFGSFGLWAFLSVATVALFAVFIPLVTWIDARGKEREAFYKADTIRRLAESSGEGAKAAMELMREEGRQKQIRTQEGLKIAGLINVGVGIALVIFLRSLLGGGNTVWLCGIIPGMIGVAMLVYVFAFARPVESR
jgi:hypothetical protein